eukprot:scaffold126697_cov32-Tisochrysis_lutea.AAC.1
MCETRKRYAPAEERVLSIGIDGVGQRARTTQPSCLSVPDQISSAQCGQMGVIMMASQVIHLRINVGSRPLSAEPVRYRSRASSIPYHACFRASR